MPVAVQIDFKGATLDQYDQVMEKMGFSPGGPGEEGWLFHWVTKTEDGIRIVNVWWSAENLEQFWADRMGRWFQEAGFSGLPEIQLFEVHNYLTAGPRESSDPVAEVAT